METINTSGAEKVNVTLSPFDELPIVATYTDDATGVALNIAAWAFEFVLKRHGQPEVVATYNLAANVASSAMLVKEGVDNNQLNMEGMWENVRTLTKTNVPYVLYQNITDATNRKYTHLIYNVINRA